MCQLTGERLFSVLCQMKFLCICVFNPSLLAPANRTETFWYQLPGPPGRTAVKTEREFSHHEWTMFFCSGFLFNHPTFLELFPVISGTSREVLCICETWIRTDLKNPIPGTNLKYCHLNVLQQKWWQMAAWAMVALGLRCSGYDCRNLPEVGQLSPSGCGAYV